SKSLTSANLIAATPLATQLERTRVWKKTVRSDSLKSARSAPPPVSGDKTRVNIVSEPLCDDILSYIGKSLEPHQGCDLIDLYPGAGLWSTKLHNFLKPRSHIMMEPDADLYRPFLEPLLERKGTTLIPKSGIVWHELNDILTPEHLPNQTVHHKDSPGANMKNDTLLVTCNLAFHPRKRLFSFESIAMLLIHQFMDAIKNGALFHKYGLVRMLLWVRREDKINILPRLIQNRRRPSTDAELYCEAINEVVTHGGPEKKDFNRDENIERASALAVLNRMKKANIKVPEGRESDAFKQAMLDSALKPKAAPNPGSCPPVMKRNYLEMQASLEEKQPQHGTAEFKRLQEYGWRRTADTKRLERAHNLFSRHEELTQLKQAGKISDEELHAAEEQLSEIIDRLPVFASSEFTSLRDNLHIWKQDEPAMLWDKRTVEPIIAEEQEFYPNCDTCLLDIMPGPVHPLIRDIGAGSSRSGECFELIQKSMWANPKAPIDKALDGVYPGAADWILPRCPSFRDPARGGCLVNAKHMTLTVRTLNRKQWEELLEQWYAWPFHPEFRDLVARSQD
ncbi:hypothetical protein BKA67DRAFT_492159, partial [Truncatella angustata]